jgi:hypothetical protein
VCLLRGTDWIFIYNSGSIQYSDGCVLYHKQPFFACAVFGSTLRSRETKPEMRRKLTAWKCRAGQCAYNVTVWSVHVTTTAVETQQCVVCVCVVVELHVTVNYIKILNVAQQCFHGESVAGNTGTHVDLHVKCPMLHLNKLMFFCS